MNTANTYVISAPGYYKIPLVYGNAIKNGTANVGAYHQSTNGVSIVASFSYSGSSTTWTASDNRCKFLANFVGHADEAIWTNHDTTDPYIKNHYTPANACLVWQDASGLVSNVSYDATGNGFIKFYVNPSTIAQGNAIIAIRNSSNVILWSWQIWVTPTDIMETVPIKNHQGYTYNMMSVNLGWCAENVAGGSYASRNVIVKVRQKKNGNVVGNTATFTLLQFTHSNIAPLGNNSYYQWGRKDPLLGGKNGRYNGTVDDPTYGDKAYYSEVYPRTVEGSDDSADWPSLSKTLGKCIQTPYIEYHISATNWYDQNDINLWNASKKVLNSTESTWFNDDAITKTVYDPSPVGFCIPPSNVFTGFTTTGENVAASNWNITSVANYGVYFKTGINNNTIYFPCTGQRENFSGSTPTFNRCHVRGSLYWNGYGVAVTTASQTTKYHFPTFLLLYYQGNNSDLLQPKANGGEKGYGFAVRPKTE